VYTRPVRGLAPRFLSLLVAVALTGAAQSCLFEPYPAPAASCDATCDDGSPCTLDHCDPVSGGCVFDALLEGTSVAGCDDGDVCNGLERCAGDGSCAQGYPVVVDDRDDCTDDACDAATGIVTHAAIPGCGITWQPLGTTDAPTARALHSALWTGSEMIVWGGKVAGMPNVTNTGARWDPATDTWTPTSLNGAPSPRHSHSAVWTGTTMIVWGGFGAAGYEVDGGIYDPATDGWTPIGAGGAPSGRTLHGTVWTGNEMIVWGGLNGVNPLGTGGRFDPASGWQPLPQPGSPGPRLSHVAVWTGSEMIVWGGTDTFDWLGDGAYLDGSGWTGTVEQSGAPSFRESATGIWTGSTMIVWGGWNGGNFPADGAVLDPAAGVAGAWTPMATDGAPSPRAKQLSLWTGAELLVWGGCAGNACDVELDDGGRWLPGDMGGTWSALLGGGPSARVDHRGVWTGSEMVIWGGRHGTQLLGDGGRLVVE
jgi:slime mold repeat-containing protein